MQNRHQDPPRPGHQDVTLRVPPRQWLMGDAATTVRCRAVFDLGAWRVFAGDDLAVWPLVTTRGEEAGCLIGTPIDLARTAFVDGPLRLPSGIELEHAGDAERQILQWLASFAGVFVVVVRLCRSWTLYLSAANSCVYDTQTGRIGTTAAAFLPHSDYDARLDRALIRTMAVAGPGWLPAGLTGHSGVHRLLPNHALDLASLRPRRVWHGATRTGTPPEILVESIAEIATRTITAAARSHRLTLALSAGRDSRAVLALTASLGLRPETFTVAHAGAGLDVTVGRELSQALGLRHTPLAPVMADAAGQELWMRRNGHAVGGINRILHPTLHVFDKSCAVLAGSFGEIGRGYYWNGLTDIHARLSAKGLLDRFDLPRDDRVLSSLDHWLNDVASTDALQVLDLAYLEHRLGAWAAPQQAAEHELPALRDVEERVGHERDRLDGRMHLKLIHAAGLHGVDAGIVPDVRAVAATIAKAEGVRVRGRADLEHEDHLVLGAVERAHAAVGLVPDADVLQLGEDAFTSRYELTHVTPVHADEGNRAIPAGCSGMTEREREEGHEGLPAHLAGGEGELPVPGCAEA